MRNARQSVLVALTLVGAATCAVATTMTVHLKDGTVAKFDSSKIASVTFSEAASNTQSPTTKPVFEETFRSGLSATWEPIAVVGGDYNRFAKVTPGRLEVNVPAGNSWTKTGIMSAQPLFTVTPGMETAPVRIELTFDAAKTTGYVIGLTEVKDADMWRQQNVWFHFGQTSPTESFSYLVNTQNSGESYGTAKGPATAPTTVTLTITPGFVRVETSNGVREEGKFSWLRAGAPVYFYIFTHPKDNGGPAAFALQGIRMYTGH